MLVSPANGLKEISVAQMRQLTRYGVNRSASDPFARRKLQYVHSGVFGWEMRARVLGLHPTARSSFTSLRRIRGQSKSWSRPGELLDRVVADANLLAFQRIGDHVWASGVKILPVKLPDGRRVLPTREHVMSGTYPYYCSLMLVVPTKASPAVHEVAAALLAPGACRGLRDHWMTAETPNPDLSTPQQTIWPPLDFAAAAPHAASVAVLPVEQLSAYFRLTDKTVQARYEDDLSAGIERTKTITLLDRAQLRRVLTERATKLLSGTAGEPQPIVSADVIVLGRVVSRHTVAYLRIEAFHSGTASCIGLMELPIDPAHPAKFAPSLEELVAGWWPGVMANLARARKGPIWTLTEEAAMVNDPALIETRTALVKTLATAEGIFFARYSHVPAAQREVLLRLMGLARPAGRLAIAADYVVALGKSGHSPKVSIRRGTDTKAHAERTFVDGGAAAWLREQLTSRANKTVASGTPAETQARQEYQRGMAIKKQREAFIAEARARSQAANHRGYLPADKARLDELMRQIDRHFERAMQLNPADEPIAFENLKAVSREQSDYVSLRDSVRACLQFIERHPQSKNFGFAVMKGSYGLSYLREYLGDPYARARKSLGIPPHIDYRKLIPQYHRQHLSLLAAAMQRAGDKREGGYGCLKSRLEYARDYQRLLDRYAAIASPQELNDALDEYGRACDALAAQVLRSDVPRECDLPQVAHSDFLRLRYMARRGEKQEYLDLLARMQRRWPDRAGEHWKCAGEQTVREMCELFRMDPRRSSLYQWLKGRRGPGDLPYVGYQAAPQPATK